MGPTGGLKIVRNKQKTNRKQLLIYSSEKYKLVKNNVEVSWYTEFRNLLKNKTVEKFGCKEMTLFGIFQTILAQ